MYQSTENNGATTFCCTLSYQSIYLKFT